MSELNLNTNVEPVMESSEVNEFWLDIGRPEDVVNRRQFIADMRDLGRPEGDYSDRAPLTGTPPTPLANDISELFPLARGEVVAVELVQEGEK